MQTKQYLYAAVGAPVTVAKSAQNRVGEIRGKLNKSKVSLAEDLKKQVGTWAEEGEQFVGKIGDSKTIDEIAERVDLDQVQEQVSKLRDQLEDLLVAWRANFRPGGKPAKTSQKIEVEVTKTTAAKKPVAKKPVAKKPVAKKPVAKKPAAKTTATKKPAAKTMATTSS